MWRSLGLAICFHRFLFPLSSKFPDLNFAPYVLDARNPYVTNSEPGLPVVRFHNFSEKIS